jgi:hypothetical protein
MKASVQSSQVLPAKPKDVFYQKYVSSLFMNQAEAHEYMSKVFAVLMKKKDPMTLVQLTAFFPALGRYLSGPTMPMKEWLTKPAKQCITIPQTFDYGEDSCGAVEDESLAKFKVWTVFYRKPQKKVGGAGKYNDCLFDCMLKAVGTENNLPSGIRTPAHLKKFLGVPRDAMIATSAIPIIDQYLAEHKPAYCISCEDVYTSPRMSKAKFCIRLRLHNEHYELLCNEGRARTQGVLHKKEGFIIYRHTGFETVEYCLDTVCETVDLAKWENEMRPKFKHLAMVYYKGVDDLMTVWKKRKADTDALFNATKGIYDFPTVNMNNYPSVRVGVLDLFRQSTKALKSPEPIDSIEAYWLDRAFSGGLIWAEKYDGDAVGYDCNSAYPSAMLDQRFQFPVRQGEFMQLTQEAFDKWTYLKFGIYRCEIECSHPHFAKSFHDKPSNEYTTKDLRVVQELGGKITLIQDGQANFLYYSKDKLINCKFMQKYIETFYELKQQGVPLAKDFLNMLWGSMSQKKFKTLVFATEFAENDRYEFAANEKIESIIPTSDEKGHVFKYFDKNDIWETDYARIAPFLTAFVRYEMYKTMQKIGFEKIVRIHTDGIIVKEETNVLPLSDAMGDWKVERVKVDGVKGPEKRGHVIVRNAMIVKWDV